MLFLLLILIALLQTQTVTAKYYKTFWQGWWNIYGSLRSNRLEGSGFIKGWELDKLTGYEDNFAHLFWPSSGIFFYIKKFISNSFACLWKAVTLLLRILMKLQGKDLTKCQNGILSCTRPKFIILSDICTYWYTSRLSIVLCFENFQQDWWPK